MTKVEAEKQQRTRNRQVSERRWDRYIKVVKEAYSNPESSIHSTSHPCRPRVEHIKSAVTRRVNASKYAKAVRPHRIMKRKYVSLLDEQAHDFVTRENLDAKIQYALSHPVSYNVSSQKIIYEEARIKERLRLIRVKV